MAGCYNHHCAGLARLTGVQEALVHEPLYLYLYPAMITIFAFD